MVGKFVGYTGYFPDQNTPERTYPQSVHKFFPLFAGFTALIHKQAVDRTDKKPHHKQPADKSYHHKSDLRKKTSDFTDKTYHYNSFSDRSPHHKKMNHPLIALAFLRYPCMG